MNDSEAAMAEARRRIVGALEDGATHLELSDLGLTTLPTEMGNLDELIFLNLSNNNFTTLPSVVRKLKRLQSLYMIQNQLTELPPEIGRLNSLYHLDLDGNKLTSLPPEIGSLTELSHLDLRNNHLTNLPSEIGNLTKLSYLDFENNQLNRLPDEIGNLIGLKELYLENNRLASLPSGLADLTNLEGFDLSDNPLPRSYFDALDDGIPTVLALLRSLKGETAPIYEAKLVITGEGQVGKSWALAALNKKKPSEVVGSANTTWGIDRGELILPHPKEPNTNIHLNTWDFGGQAVYRVTHQFFFSEQALFLLAWNPRKGAMQCRVRHWLRTIALRTGSDVPPGAPERTAPRPRARVIMVATHAKAEGGAYSPEYGHDSLDVDLQAMIVDAIEIDSETGYNVEELRKLVAHHAAALPDMGSPLNAKWAAARDAALQLRNNHPWITFDRFADLCAEKEVTNTADQRTLAATFMNRLGRAVWYGPGAEEDVEDEDALLADTLVLDAVWLSRAFVQVLEHTPTREAGGMLDHRDFRKIWTDHGRKEWHKYAPGEYGRLTRMMRRFDVALPTRASSGERSLVPQLVPALRPDLPWTAPEQAPGKRLVRLACQLDYETEGLMARFIAATEPYHVYQDGKGLFWQEGVFLSDRSFNNQALVTVEGTEKPLLSIDVSGDQPGFLVNELYRTLEAVIDFWKGATRTYFIRCPKGDSDEGYCRGRFKFKTVLRRAAKDKGRELDCQECDEEWTPEQLLHGLEAVRKQSETDRQIAYLFYEKKLPCPRAFILRPADTKWQKVTSWASFVGKRFHFTLVSEFSGKEVASTEFTIPEEWTKWIGPLTRVASFALTGLAVPLDGDIAEQLKDSAEAMDKLGSLPAEDGGNVRVEAADKGRQRAGNVAVTEAQIRQLQLLIEHVGLDPKANGMELAETRDGRWFWMTAEEAAAHSRPDARFDVTV